MESYVSFEWWKLDEGNFCNIQFFKYFESRIRHFEIIFNVIGIDWDESRLNFIYLKTVKTAPQIESLKPNVKRAYLFLKYLIAYTLK